MQVWRQCDLHVQPDKYTLFMYVHEFPGIGDTLTVYARTPQCRLYTEQVPGLQVCLIYREN
uniref:Alpha-galactosidase n=1 Tax=Ascaris lumbricoides TaxID=6252 RepID=A0A0M3HKB0_ASCLU